MPLLIYIFIAFYRLFLAAGQTKEEERRMRIIRDIFTCGTRTWVIAPAVTDFKKKSKVPELVVNTKETKQLKLLSIKLTKFLFFFFFIHRCQEIRLETSQ
jgi:hypothetical protein